MWSSVCAVFSLLSLPFAFAQSGWLVGSLCMVGVGLLSLTTMQAMIDAVHLTRQRLRRRKKASMAHSASKRSLAAMMEAANASTIGSGYGSTLELPASPMPSPGPDALDPLDLSIIKADPDADVSAHRNMYKQRAASRSTAGRSGSIPMRSL